MLISVVSDFLGFRLSLCSNSIYFNMKMMYFYRNLQNTYLCIYIFLPLPLFPIKEDDEFAWKEKNQGPAKHIMFVHFILLSKLHGVDHLYVGTFCCLSCVFIIAFQLSFFLSIFFAIFSIFYSSLITFSALSWMLKIILKKKPKVKIQGICLHVNKRTVKDLSTNLNPADTSISSQD